MYEHTARPQARAGRDGSDDVLARLAPVSHAVFRVARLHKTLAGQLLRNAGLYPNQELVMMRLWTDGPQRQVDLVRMLESEAPIITRTIKRLEKSGLVRTSRSTDDGRVIIVEATAESRGLRDEVEKAWATLESWTIQEWDDDMRTAVLDALGALEANLAAAEPTQPESDGPGTAV